MTKAQMINYIEKSGMMVNFSRSYLEKRLKSEVERLYIMAVKYTASKRGVN